MFEQIEKMSGELLGNLKIESLSERVFVICFLLEMQDLIQLYYSNYGDYMEKMEKRKKKKKGEI